MSTMVIAAYFLSVARRALLSTMFAMSMLAAQFASAPVSAEEVQNLTGLPVYPNLSAAAMDRTVKTDTMGHWCARFSAVTPYPLEVVEAWYRRTLVGASETDLTHDETYKSYAALSGIKLAMGIDYVTVFKMSNQTATSIELFRCSALR